MKNEYSGRKVKLFMAMVVLFKVLEKRLGEHEPRWQKVVTGFEDSRDFYFVLPFPRFLKSSDVSVYFYHQEKITYKCFLENICSIKTRYMYGLYCSQVHFLMFIFLRE